MPLRIIGGLVVFITLLQSQAKAQPSLEALTKAIKDIEKQEVTERVNQKIQEARQTMDARFLPSPHGEFAAIKEDILRVPPDRRLFVRYMTGSFVPNRKEELDFVDFVVDQSGREIGLVPDEKNSFIAKTNKQAITRWQLINRIASFGLNSLSQYGEIVPLETVPNTDGRIVRFYLDDYKIRRETWEWFVAPEPYFRHIADEEVAKLCGSHKPLIRTDWFLANAFEEPNYSVLLYSSFKAVPKTDAEIHTFYRFNISDVKLLERDYRAAVNGEASFVANRSRRLNRYSGILDYLHISDDFKSNKDFVTETKDAKSGKTSTKYTIKDPIENLLDPGHPEFFNQPQAKQKGDVTYKPDAHEGIHQLPNRLQGYYITNAEGVLVPEADPKIVRDTRNSHEPVVFNGKSCMWCHDRGMNIPVNTARQHLGKRIDPKAYDQETIRLLKRLYDTEYGAHLLRDSQSFCLAVAQCNRLDATANGNAFREFIQWYDYNQLNAAQCCIELGVTLEQFQEAVQKSTSVRLMGLFGNPPTPIPRELWEERFQSVVLLIKL